MHKSKGNVVAPEQIIRKHGAEVLRLWVAAEDYRDDIRISPDILERLTESYRKIRNTIRFLLGTSTISRRSGTPSRTNVWRKWTGTHSSCSTGSRGRCGTPTRATSSTSSSTR